MKGVVTTDVMKLFTVSDCQCGLYICHQTALAQIVENGYIPVYKYTTCLAPKNVAKSVPHHHCSKLRTVSWLEEFVPEVPFSRTSLRLYSVNIKFAYAHRKTRESSCVRRSATGNVEKTLESDRLQPFYAPLDDLFDV